MECQICCERFNKSNHSKVACHYCNFAQCSSCAQRYLLETPNDPHCMNCKTGWNRERLVDNFTKKFVDKTFKERRENLLFERERALMPATQPAAERRAKLRAIEKKIQENNQSINECMQRFNDVCHQLGFGQNQLGDEKRIEIYERALKEKEKEDHFRRRNLLHQYEINLLNAGPQRNAPKREFIRACPADGCRGFLSTAWKCGMCEVKVCPQCHEIKNGDEEHTCNPENVETAKLLAKDTRACPKCASMIFKIDGCDQMYCTQCNTAFSWRTGQIEAGRIHNPHYYDYLRRVNNGTIPREPGDVPHNAGGCAEMPAAQMIQAVTRQYASKAFDFFLTIVQQHWHAHYTLTHRYQVNAADGNNEEMRILYMIGDLDEEKFKKELQKKEKARQRKSEIYDILNTYMTVSREQMQNAVRNYNIAEEVKKISDEMHVLRDYINDEFGKVSRRYNCVVPRVDPSWYFATQNYNKV
jgi:hypothetical protein